MRYFIILASVLICVVAYQVSAQEDTTPPVLLEFTLAPTMFDAGQDSITVDWCATARDVFSGLRRVSVFFQFIAGGQLANDTQNFPEAVLEDEICGAVIIPQGSLYESYFVVVQIADITNNVVDYVDTNIAPTNPDLCAIGPCYVVNRLAADLPDTDGDGVPDDADNCPDIANADQADADLDLIGDACDPFPSNRDNEQAQCDLDLTQAQAETATCGLDLGQCQGDLGTAQTALQQVQTDLQQALAAIDAMRACLASYKKENGVRCRDGIDNDCDGLVDSDDPDC